MTTFRHGEITNEMEESARDYALKMFNSGIATLDMKAIESRANEIELLDKKKHELEMSNKIKLVMSESGIPERYRDSRFSKWIPENDEKKGLFDDINRWKAGQFRSGGSLVLCGGVGTGKTWIACGLVADAIERGYSATYSTAKAYTGLIKETYRKASKNSEVDILERFCGVELLAIDEVGRQFESISENLYIFDLINERYNRLKPTILITNLDKIGLVNFLGDAIIDRLKEGGGMVLNLNWGSLRC